MELLFEQRTVCGASSVILTFLVRAECVPNGGAEDILLGYVMHANGDAEHRAKGDKVSTYVTVGDSAVVSAPVIHNRVCILEGRAADAVATGSEPGAGPGIVGSLPDSIGYVVGKIDGPSLSDLKHGAKTLNEIKSYHSAGDLCLGEES